MSKAEREWKEEEKFDCFLQSKLEQNQRLECIIYWAWSVSYILGRSVNFVCFMISALRQHKTLTPCSHSENGLALVK